MKAMHKPVEDKPGRILVVGGRGFLGQRVVRALDHVSGVDVKAGSRRSESGRVQLDLCAPDTFAAVDGFDVVVNCADTLAAPPDPLLGYCLERGVAFVDAGADADTIERLLADAGVRWAPIPRVALGIRGELVVPLVRHTFTLGDPFVVAQTGAIGGRGLASVTVRFP